MNAPAKVVWITGGGTGIGRALALAYTRSGHRVAVSGRRLDRLEATVQKIRLIGGEAISVPCDVTVEAQIQSAVDCIIRQFGRLDIAIANAGFGVRGRIENLTPDDWTRQLSINLIGAAQTVRYALPELQKTSGRAVLISSVMAYMRSERHGAYAASKAALTSTGETLAIELMGTGVSCTTIHPGYVESEIGQVGNDGQFSKEIDDHRPVRWMWTSEDAAEVIIAAVARRARLYTFTWHGWFAQFMARHFPGILHRVAIHGLRTRSRQIDITHSPNK